MSQTQNTSTTSASSRVWFITGCSRGFGRALAAAVIARGERVVVTARNPEQVQDLVSIAPQRVLALPLDVTNEQQCQAAAAQAQAHFGQIGVLVNNAGYGLFGAVEEVSSTEVRGQFETNVFGLLNVTRSVLPVMRTQHHGHIIMMSSLSGQVGNMGSGMYAASKFAVEGLSEALAQEVAPLGIHVTLVEPGLFRTDFVGQTKVAQRKIDDYAATVGAFLAGAQMIDGYQPGDPGLAAAAIIKVVETDTPPLHLVLGADALQMIRGKVANMTKEWEVWEGTTVATAFPDGFERLQQRMAAIMQASAPQEAPSTASH